jgi:predicted XRE-type DNA-binding protein
MSNSFAGDQNPNWKGGRRVDSRGYIEINVGEDHPMASKNRRYVGEHRLVMAEKLGRMLTSDELVHHIDENKQNNDPANLEIEDRSTHMTRHYANKPRPSAGKQPRKNGRWVGIPREPRVPGKRGPAMLTLEAKVWPKIDQSPGPDECHPWMSVRNKDGYGKIGHGRNRKLYAARVVYELVHGPIEDPTLVVRHTCDNPPCCNPKHLILGTRGDNNRDRGERKRGREQRQYGEANTNVKVKDADLPRIHELRAAGWTQMQIAAEFGVKQPQISRILSGNQRQKGTSE